jgi:hypothetical protein
MTWGFGFSKRKTFESWPHIWQAYAYPHFQQLLQLWFFGLPQKMDFYFINAWEIFCEVATN